MLVPSTLFYYIRNSHGLDCFPKLSKHSIGVRRYQRSKTLEQKEAFRKKMSEVMSKIMPGVRKRYCANCTPAQKKAFAKRASKISRAYWDNTTLEERRINAIPAKIATAKYHADRKKASKVYASTSKTHKIGSIEENLPRINNYRGVITESQLEEMYA